VLVIDDDAATRALVAAALEAELDVAVRGAGGGREGILSVAAEPPDLIFLDLRMPDLDGFAVLHWLKSKPRTASIPVLALTAAASAATLQALERRCDGLVAKPFDLDDLVGAARAFLGAAPRPSAGATGTAFRFSVTPAVRGRGAPA
jgi:CheY-like chemotaxis protein